MFFVITTIVITYANGYALSLDKRKFVKTGTFVLDSVPKGAEIFIDGERVNLAQIFDSKSFATTPAKIKNINPGDYEVTFKLDGYHSWTKKLTISPGSATFAETVSLFKDAQPELAFDQLVEKITVNKKASLAILKGEKNTALFDLNNGQISTIYATASPDTFFGNQDQLVQIGRNIYNLFSPDSAHDLAKLIGTNTPALRIKDDEASVLFNHDNQLSIYNLAKKQSVTAIASTTGDNIFTVGAYYGSLTRQANSLQLSINDRESIIVPMGLYDFRPVSDSLLALNRTDIESMYLIDLNQASVRAELPGFSKTDYLNQDNIVVASDHEISSYNINDNTTKLLARLSDRINSIYLHNSKNYIIFVGNTFVRSLELDDRDHRNITDIADFDEINDSYFNHLNNQLYIAGEFKGHNGLYVIKL